MGFQDAQNAHRMLASPPHGCSRDELQKLALKVQTLWLCHEAVDVPQNDDQPQAR
jgi:hypothetical protein